MTPESATRRRPKIVAIAAAIGLATPVMALAPARADEIDAQHLTGKGSSYTVSWRSPVPRDGVVVEPDLNEKFTARGTYMVVQHDKARRLTFRVRDQERGYWYLRLTPPQGQRFRAGADYRKAVGNSAAPAPASRARFEADGAGRGCTRSSSRVTIKQIELGRLGYVQNVDLSFRMLCRDGTVAQGRLLVREAAPPPDLKVSIVPERITVDRAGRAVQVTSVRCNRAARLVLGGGASQPGAGASLDSFTLPCTGRPQRLATPLSMGNAAVFRPGAPATASGTADATDFAYPLVGTLRTNFHRTVPVVAG